MKKNKGFVFVETIVVIVVLLVGIVTLYVSFTSVSTNESKRASFNNIKYIYKTFYIRDYLASIKIKDYAKAFEEDNYYTIFNCSNNLIYFKEDNLSDAEYAKRMNYCNSFMEEMGNPKIYIFKKDNIKEIKGAIRNGNYNNFSTIKELRSTMKYYLKTLKVNDFDDDSEYILVIEYNEIVEKKAENITKDDNGKCPNGYSQKGNDCYLKFNKYYYNSAELIDVG